MLFIHWLALNLFQKILGGDKILSLLYKLLIKKTLDAVTILGGEDALLLSSAEGSGHHPAGPSGIFAAMDTVKTRFYGRRADAKLADLVAAGLAAAAVELPAVLLGHRPVPSLRSRSFRRCSRSRRKSRSRFPRSNTSH